MNDTIKSILSIPGELFFKAKLTLSEPIHSPSIAEFFFGNPNVYIYMEYDHSESVWVLWPKSHSKTVIVVGTEEQAKKKPFQKATWHEYYEFYSVPLHIMNTGKIGFQAAFSSYIYTNELEKTRESER